ncbi:MAG: LTA synthase family protein [Bacteroidales bacterium]|nr:LTA synthase family protein [Bacteroidales bacterium]
MKRNVRFNYLLVTYLIGIVIFTVFRLINTLVYCINADPWPDFEGLYGRALVMGWRFDTVVSCYLLAIPAIMMVIGELAHIKKHEYYRVIHVLLVVGFLIAFFACAVDVPFFSYFYNRLNAVAINEIDSIGIVVDMIFSDLVYVAGLLAYAALAVGYIFLMRRVYRGLLRDRLEDRLPLGWAIPVSVVLLLAVFVGMRGRLSKKSPIRVGTAYFCNNGFLNQLGLNPVFTFVKSAEDISKASNRPIALTTPEKALETYEAERALPLDSTLMPEGLSLPLPEGTNVVLVIMESMTVDNTGLFYPEHSLTPHLDSLMAHGLVFTECYSAGIHTYNGIYSALYSHPALLSRHTMKHTTMPVMHGLPQQLHDVGYRNLFFLTHDEDYDNMRGFLMANGFDEVIGQSCYPSEEIVGTWGVPDHVLFDHVVERCNAAVAQGPFFVAVMTCSDHTPYIIPTNIDFKPKNIELSQKAVEYADWAIGRFMENASRQPWFENTLFVFVADHGAAKPFAYDVSLPYHHIPLLYYAPKYIAPCRTDRLALQLDLAPTLTGMLPYEVENRALGLDLLRQKRRFAYFSSDDKISVLDGEYLYLYRASSGKESLYHYSDTLTDDFVDRFPEKVASMRDYAFGMIQQSYQMLTAP